MIHLFETTRREKVTTKCGISVPSKFANANHEDSLEVTHSYFKADCGNCKSKVELKKPLAA